VQSFMVGRQREMLPQPALLHAGDPPGMAQHLSVLPSQVLVTHLQQGPAAYVKTSAITDILGNSHHRLGLESVKRSRSG
jgi:hypothetical protein